MEKRKEIMITGAEEEIMLLPTREGNVYEKYFKRIFDITCALGALVCFWPLYLVVAVLVKLKLGSPVLFIQKRPGIAVDGKETVFKMYKFRTMTDERNLKTGELLPDEVRVTKFGRWLRASSLDELPEVINILNGTMSVIGPRPQLIRDMVFMTASQRMRHTVRPGLSGLAQINGRNAISWEEKLDLDLKYIHKIGFLNDIKILLATVGKVFVKREGITNGNMATAEDFGDYLLRTGKISAEEYTQKQAEARSIQSQKKRNVCEDYIMTVEEQIERNSKVSVIVPMYNAVSTLKETIGSVQAQTYSNWELILVDDCSKDGTLQYAESLADEDKRIKVYQMPHNSGPGAATRRGFEKSTGGLIAFIDADDLWKPEKLERQIGFMIRNNYEFVCSDYCWIDERGNSLDKTIKCRKVADYRTVLKSCPIGSSTVVITARQMRKTDIPLIRKNNDYALWLRLMRDGTKIYGMNEVLMEYRIMSTSNSFCKRKMIPYFWKVYREYDGFSIIKSSVLLGQYIFIKAIGMK